MAKLSIVIPSRDEKFLTPTIDDIFRNARGEIEVVAVLDSNLWPGDWKEVTERHGNRLHTIHNGTPRGMRAAINNGVASAKSRGAKYIMKTDAHCMFAEGFDETLKAEIDRNWIVIPRRKRLDADNWTLTETHKPDIDYHYLSFPDNPQDWGGKGLNGRPWPERAVARKDILVDDEMSSQGSCWMAHVDYFYELELMDEDSYGKFWNEAQEVLLKCWLSGGRGVINKKTWYAHLHKGTKHGRGYKLPESWLQQGATFTKRWMFNEAWDKQTLPFKWLIEHFWPVPTWPENWEEILYATRKLRVVSIGSDMDNSITARDTGAPVSLKIIAATYGIGHGDIANTGIDVTSRLRSLVKDNSLDIIVNNSTLVPGQNPYRGKKKFLSVIYTLDNSPPITITRQEKDWLIIGPARELSRRVWAEAQADGIPVKHNAIAREVLDLPKESDSDQEDVVTTGKYIANRTEGKITFELDVPPPRTPAALNDYLIRRFQISPQRLRGPMPIELREFHRNDLAQLFAELGFRSGAEIGVAEGRYTEVLLKANPECQLILVDPWHHYSDNPQGKSHERHEFAYNETVRKTKGYKVDIRIGYSIDEVQGIPYGALDFAYIDGHHGYEYVMQDIIEWTKRVRSGGIVAGDDVYKLNEKWGAGPMEAIYDYTRAMRINPWWLINAHKSVDFFFVKP